MCQVCLKIVRHVIPGRERICKTRGENSEKRAKRLSNRQTTRVRKFLGVLGFLLFLMFGAIVWRAYVFAPDGAGSWEVRTKAGGTGIDGLFVYNGIPENIGDVWDLVVGDVPIKRYEADTPINGYSVNKESGNASDDFKRSVITARTAADSLLRQWQISGDGSLEVTESSGYVLPGERIIGINGGPASLYLWREAVSGSSRERWPVYLRVRDENGYVRPVVVVLAGDRHPGGVRVRVRAVPDEGRHLLLPGNGMSGPSAGLAIALGFFNQDTGRCLELGGEIAASGAITDSGEVLGVGGIKDKTEAAVAAGDDFLFVAHSNVAAAREAARGRIRVVGVGRVSEAVSVLADDWRVRECLNRAQARERAREAQEDTAWRNKTAVLPAGQSGRRTSAQR